MGTLTFELGSLQVAARFSRTTEFKLSSEPPGTGLDEYSLLAGFVRRFGPGRLFADAGIGLVQATRLVSAVYSAQNGMVYQMASTTTANLPLEVGISADSHFIGGGLAIVANLNSAAAFVGVFFFLDVGKVH
jgi:hypothetical protein